MHSILSADWLNMHITLSADWLNIILNVDWLPLCYHQGHNDHPNTSDKSGLFLKTPVKCRLEEMSKMSKHVEL